MKLQAVLIAMWRLFWGLTYYPLIFGAMIWLYVKDYHWIWGVGVIIAALVLDPIWGLIARRVISWRPHNSR